MSRSILPAMRRALPSFALPLLGLGFGLALAACNTTVEAQLETYEDGPQEDYGCIVGDLDCECAAGDVCDQGLVCQNGICVCESGDCEPMGPMTSGMDEADAGSDTMSTEADTADTMDTTDMDMGESTTDADTTDTTDTTESTDTTDTTDTTTDTGDTDTTTDTGDTTTDTGGMDTDTGGTDTTG